MSDSYITNPFAPTGLAVPPPAGFRALPAIYVYERTLTSGQILTNETVSIHTDSDFFARGIVLASATGSFLFQFADESGYFTSNSYITSAALPSNAALPFPIAPQLRYSAGGRTTLNIQDTSLAENAIQIWFIGTRVFNASK